MNTLNAAAARAVATVRNRLADLTSDRDRGSGVVETVIIVAGFAGLAFTVYLAVSGKVTGWINKIPGSTSP